MIRQAISCDQCGAEKKQTNHWFVSYNHGGELRVCRFNSQTRLRSGSKHLCGQACLHKMIDEYISGILAGRAPSSAVDAAEAVEPAVTTELSLTSRAAYRAVDASPKSVQTVSSIVPQSIAAPIPAAVVSIQPRLLSEQPRAIAAQPPMPETPNYASRHWRAEAWERERERELRANDRHQDAPTRHRKSS